MSASAGVREEAFYVNGGRIGTGGMSLRVPSAHHHPVPLPDLLRLVRSWSDAHDSGLIPAFPQAETISYLRSVGRANADSGLVEELRRAHKRMAPGSGQLDSWLPMTFDRDDGDYHSYIGSGVLESMSCSGEPTPDETDIDLLLTTAAADLVCLEAEALAACPEAPQRTRLRAVLRVLARAPELALRMAPRDHLFEGLSGLDRTGQGDDPQALAEAAHLHATAVMDRMPAMLCHAVAITLIPMTRLHDEQMFIRSIQIFECVYRQVAAGVSLATGALGEGDAATATRVLEDCARRVEATKTLFRVLTTMPPDVFAVIRENTPNRSAVQSRSYRNVETWCGAQEDQDSGLPRGVPTGQAVTTLAECAEQRRTDLDPQAASDLQATMNRLDSAWRAMKLSHWGVTLKVIGQVPGTGGTSGADYLRARSEERLFLPVGPSGERPRTSSR